MSLEQLLTLYGFLSQAASSGGDGWLVAFIMGGFGLMATVTSTLGLYLIARINRGADRQKKLAERVTNLEDWADQAERFMDQQGSALTAAMPFVPTDKQPQIIGMITTQRPKRRRLDVEL